MFGQSRERKRSTTTSEAHMNTGDAHSCWSMTGLTRAPVTGTTSDHRRASPPGLAYWLICLISAVVVGVFEPAISKADPSSPAPGPPASGGAVTLQDLLFAPVPGLCQHDPGNLVNGQLPPQDSHPGQVMIAKRTTQSDNSYKVAFGNLTGDGNTDAAMVTDCTAGGVPWLETVQLYTAGPARLGGVNLDDLTHSREVVTDLSITDGVAHVTWLANGPNDAECCPTIKMAADLRWDGSTVSAQNVRRLN
jgi:hypothetical protein